MKHGLAVHMSLLAGNYGSSEDVRDLASLKPSTQELLRTLLVGVHLW